MIAPKSFEYTRTHNSFRSFNIPFGQKVEKLLPVAVYYYSSDRLRIFSSLFVFHIYTYLYKRIVSFFFFLFYYYYMCIIAILYACIVVVSNTRSCGGGYTAAVYNIIMYTYDILLYCCTCNVFVRVSRNDKTITGTRIILLFSLYPPVSIHYCYYLYVRDDKVLYTCPKSQSRARVQ